MIMMADAVDASVDHDIVISIENKKKRKHNKECKFYLYTNQMMTFLCVVWSDFSLFPFVLFFSSSSFFIIIKE